MKLLCSYFTLHSLINNKKLSFLFIPCLLAVLAPYWLLLMPGNGAALAEEAALAGPIAVEQARVIDGDTLEVIALIWLDQRITTRVRLLGVDTPETHSKCLAEREAAARATRLAQNWLETHAPLVLRDLRHDKYGRRVVARVQSARETAAPGSGQAVRADLAEALLAAGLARRYDGGTKQHWC